MSSVSASAGRILARCYSIPLLLLAWQALAMSGAVSPRILPDLRLVGATLLADTIDGLIPLHAAVSVARALAGYALAAVAGVALGIALARSRRIEALVEPAFIAGYPVPKIALFPVFTFVFGIGSPSKIAFVFLECLYPITIATLLAMRGVERTLVWTAASMGASRYRTLARVRIPAALPGIFTGLRIALPVTMIVVIITEMIGDSRGLGHYIAVASASFRADRIYAGIVAVGVCGFALDWLLVRLRDWIIPWQREAPRL